MYRRRQLLRLAVPATAVAAYPLWPDGGIAEALWFALVGVGCAAVMVLATRRRETPIRAAWRWFAVGVALNSLGTPVALLVSPDSYPSAGDPLYLSLYPALAIGLAALIRARSDRVDWAALIDTTTISTGLGLLTWVFVISPLAAVADLGFPGRTVSIAYPVGDIVLLSMLVRLLIGADRHNGALRAVGAGLGALLAGDATWAVFNEIGWEPTALVNQLLTMVFLGAYVLLAAAATHESVTELAEPRGRRGPGVTPVMLTLLTLASLIAPAILALEVWRGEVVDGIAIAVGSSALFVLVITRMAQLLRHVEARARTPPDLPPVAGLAGLPTRRAWNAALASAGEGARRDGRLLSVALVDLDHFKAFNDEYGHQAGDRLLRGAAAAWRSVLRGVDAIARYGGEEFIVLLPHAGGDGAAALVERLRSVTPAGQTFSAGIATWDGAEPSDELVARADRALYAAKQAGRDRTVLAGAADLPAR